MVKTKICFLRVWFSLADANNLGENWAFRVGVKEVVVNREPLHDFWISNSLLKPSQGIEVFLYLYYISLFI